MQEEQPSASMFRGFHQLTYLPHYLAPSLFFGWVLPTLFADAFTASPARLFQGSSALFGALFRGLSLSMCRKRKSS